MAGEWVELSSVRREIDKEVYGALEPLAAEGWRLRRQGHKFLLYCPCGHGGTWVRVDGSPSNPKNHARRISSEAAKCPDGHDRLHGGVSH